MKKSLDPTKRYALEINFAFLIKPLSIIKILIKS